MGGVPLTARHTEFNETTDLYLEILREAQKIEDKKLVRIIQSRLRQVRQPVYATPNGCRIIAFPRLFAQSFPQLKKPRFWPKLAYTQIAMIIAGYLLLLTGHTLMR
jgi:hypothetical protein